MGEEEVVEEPKAFGQNGIQHITVDLDDTLLPTSEDVPEGFDQAIGEIRRLMQLATQRNFPTIGGCSGREENYCRSVGYLLGRPNSWWITENGLTLWNPRTNEVLYNPNLTPEAAIILQEIAREIIPRLVLVNPFFVPYPGKRMNIAIERGRGSTQSIAEVEEKVRDALYEFVAKGLIEITHSSIAVDITPAGVTKATGIEFLSQMTGVSTKQMLSIGDSRGDFSSFEKAGFVGCPSNASEECRQLIAQREGYISPYPYAQGVVDIIRHFVGSP